MQERRRIEIPNIADFSSYAVSDPILAFLKNDQGQTMPEVAKKVKINSKMCVTRSQVVIWLKDLKKVVSYSTSSIETSFITVPLGSKSWFDPKLKKAIPMERNVVDMICSTDGQSF